MSTAMHGPKQQVVEQGVLSWIQTFEIQPNPGPENRSEGSWVQESDAGDPNAITGGQGPRQSFSKPGSLRPPPFF